MSRMTIVMTARLAAVYGLDMAVLRSQFNVVEPSFPEFQPIRQVAESPSWRGHRHRGGHKANARKARKGRR